MTLGLLRDCYTDPEKYSWPSLGEAEHKETSDVLPVPDGPRKSNISWLGCRCRFDTPTLRHRGVGYAFASGIGCP